MAIDRKLKRQLNALIERFTPDIRDAFLAAVVDITDRAALRAITDAIVAGDLDRAFRATGMSPAAMRPLARMIEQAFETGGVTVARSFPVQMADAGASIIHFDVRNSRAEAWLRDHSSQLVTRITEDVRTNIQTIVSAGMLEGRNPRNIALDIIGRVGQNGRREGGIVGLTNQQTKWVTNARTELTSVPPAENYFTRVQRDMRFDSVVRRAIREGRGLKQSEIDAMTGKYSDNLLQLRGETIARTEAMTALAKSQDEAIRQAIDNGTLNPRHVTKVWDATMDGRTRPTHMVMNGQRVNMDEAFTTPWGAKMMHPLDTSLGAPASETINCRCRVDYDVDWLADVADDPDIDWSQWNDDPTPPVSPVPPVPPETQTVRNARLDEEQKQYVLNEGRAAGVEFLSNYDMETGQVFGRNTGTKGHVSFPQDLAEAIQNPNRKISLHHNHPGSSSFSPQDVFMLNENRGMAEMWAHGHNGSSYYAKRGSNTARLRNEYPTYQANVDAEIRSYLREHGRMIDAAMAADLNRLFFHIVSSVIAKKGFIEYRAELAGETLDAANRNISLIEAVLRKF